MYQPPNEIEILESFLEALGTEATLACDCGSENLLLRGFNLEWEGRAVAGEYSFECRQCKKEDVKKIGNH